MHLIRAFLIHLLASSAGAGVGAGDGAGFGSSGGGGGGSPPSMQLLHFFSTQPSMSFSPLPPKCLPPQSLAIIPAITPTIVITAMTTTSVSIDLCEYRFGSTTLGGVSTKGCISLPIFNKMILLNPNTTLNIKMKSLLAQLKMVSL